jgi:hypothetical protein
MHLKDQLQQITDSFASTIIETLRDATLGQIEELSGGKSNGKMAHILPMPHTGAPTSRGKGPKKTKSGRLARRSDEQIAALIGKVVSLLHTAPLRAEHIRTQLGLDAREMPRILKGGIASKQLAILSGQKRSTLYTVAGAKVAATKSAKKPAKKTVKKAAKKAAKPAKKK